MTAVNHPAASRGSTVFFPAPDNPFPPEAAWSCRLSLRAFSSFSNSDRSILTVVAGAATFLANRTVAAVGEADPQPADTAARPAASPATQKRRSGITHRTLVPASRRAGSSTRCWSAGGRRHRRRLLSDRNQLRQHGQQPFHHLQSVRLGSERPRGGQRHDDLVVA